MTRAKTLTELAGWVQSQMDIARDVLKEQNRMCYYNTRSTGGHKLGEYKATSDKAMVKIVYDEMARADTRGMLKAFSSMLDEIEGMM